MKVKIEIELDTTEQTATIAIDGREPYIAEPTQFGHKLLAPIKPPRTIGKFLGMHMFWVVSNILKALKDQPAPLWSVISEDEFEKLEATV